MNYMFKPFFTLYTTNWLALPSLMSEQSLTILVMCHVVQMRNSLFMIFIFCFLIFVYTYYGYLLVSCCQYQFVNFVHQGFTLMKYVPKPICKIIVSSERLKSLHLKNVTFS